jgi:hypothetical protein
MIREGRLAMNDRTLTSNPNGYGTVFACAGCGKYSTSLVGKQIDGVWYCSTCPPQLVAALLDRAVDVMSALHRAIEPDLDHPEIPGIVPAAAMRTFVDALADIDRARCKLRPSSETYEQRYLKALQQIIMLSHEFNKERNAYAVKLEEIAHDAVTNAPNLNAECSACGARYEVIKGHRCTANALKANEEQS